MQITFEDKTGQFIALSTFEERSVPKSAGFQWDPGARQWTTRSAEKAARLEKYADAKAKQRLLRDEAVKSMFGRGQAVQADGPAAGLAALERQTGWDPAMATPLPAKRQAVEQGMELWPLLRSCL